MDVALERIRLDRDGRTVLDVPRLGFATGTTTAVFGPNGAGKTTLLRVTAGLEPRGAGSVRVRPDAEAPWRPSTAHDFAFGFQGAVFLGGSVRRNLEVALELRGHGRRVREERIAEAASACGISALLDRPARRLSAGEAQRASLARTLALRAPVTLLDEPLAGIDRATRRQLLDELPALLATFATTTVLVTHDREEAFVLADHLVVLVDGRVRAAGAKAEVWAHPRNRDTAELLGYTVLELGGREIAVPPGGVTLGRGEPELRLLVERVVDMGDHARVVGRVGARRVEVRLSSGEPAPGIGDQVPVRFTSCVALPEPTSR